MIGLLIETRHKIPFVNKEKLDLYKLRCQAIKN